jgi:hypothetical protein
LAVGLSAANTHDSQLLEQLVDAVPAVLGRGVGRVGRASARPSCTPTKATTTRAAGGVERSLAWLLANRRLTVRYERRADILTALLHFACALICARKLRPL